MNGHAKGFLEPMPDILTVCAFWESTPGNFDTFGFWIHRHIAELLPQFRVCFTLKGSHDGNTVHTLNSGVKEVIEVFQLPVEMPSCDFQSRSVQVVPILKEFFCNQAFEITSVSIPLSVSVVFLKPQTDMHQHCSPIRHLRALLAMRARKS